MSNLLQVTGFNHGFEVEGVKLVPLVDFAPTHPRFATQQPLHVLQPHVRLSKHLILFEVVENQSAVLLDGVRVLLAVRFCSFFRIAGGDLFGTGVFLRGRSELGEF